jgi:uncharacterized membrane protein
MDVGLPLLVGLHIVFAGIFVGSNVFLDFLLTPRLDLLPPGQAARLGEKLGTDFAILNWVSLIGLPVTGLSTLWMLGSLGELANPAFYLTAYGRTLTVMMTIWATLVVTGSILTFYLRPRVVVKLPYDATRQEVENARTQAVEMAKWMRWLARYNAVASTFGLVVGGFLRFGGI